MSEFAISPPANVFRPMPGHNPRSAQERYKRVHYFVSRLGAAASSQLKQALLMIRQSADNMPSPELQATARKQYTEAEFLPATKIILCIWLHLEAVDQGGEGMYGWLLTYLKLALHATDYLLPTPTAVQILESHASCEDIDSLHRSVCNALAETLGFDDCSATLAPALLPLLTGSRSTRQKLLKESLTVDQSELD